MTDAVTFKYEEGRGRFAVANREITVAARAIAHSCMLNYLCEGWRDCDGGEGDSVPHAAGVHGQELLTLLQDNEGSNSLPNLHQGHVLQFEVQGHSLVNLS